MLSVTLVNEDRLPADNTLYRVVDVASELKTLDRRGKARDQSAGRFGRLHRGGARPLDDTGKSSTEQLLSLPDLISDLDLGGKPLNDYRLMILADVAQFTAEEAQITCVIS